MDIKSNGSAYRRIKGFTLVELIIVIAIIAILAGTLNLATRGLVRNARLETLNDRAQSVYMAFQDIITDCEIKQDNSIFEPRGQMSGGDAENTNDIIGAVIFFHISAKDHAGHINVKNGMGVGDEIHIMTSHKNGVTHALAPGISSISVFAPGSTNPEIYSGSGKNPNGDHGASYWSKINDYIMGRLDATAEGSYAVSVDLENYQVLSVICRNVTSDGRDPKLGLYESSEVDDPNKALGKYINYYSNEGGHDLKVGAITVQPPQRTFILKNTDHQRDISKKIGVDIGSYPYGDTLYDNVTKPSILN